MTLSSSKILIIAGEASGDMHGAALVAELKKINPSLSFFGVGGDKMEKEGVSLVEHTDKMAIMGFTEVLTRYGFLKKVFNKVIDLAIEVQPARAILIDYPGFNLKLSKKLKEQNILVTYYIPPQLWAWHESRIEVLKKYVDQVICIFPFEKEWYKKRGINVEFVGHPFLDLKEEMLSKTQFLKKHRIPEEAQIVSLFPGSRQKEVNRHLPIMLKTIKRLKKENEKIVCIVGKAKDVTINMPNANYFKVEENTPVSALRYSDVAIVASGTVTLEAALFETPTVVIYKLSAISGFLAKLLVKVKFVSMPNLIANKAVFPELLLSDGTPEKIAAEVKYLLQSSTRRKEMLKEIKKIKMRLGRPGASRKAANLINKVITSNKND